MKRLLMMAALTSVTLAAAAQQTFTLKGVTKAETQQVVLGNVTNRQAKPDTIQVTNGQFTAKGQSQPGDVMIVIDRENRMQGFFVADAPEITVNLITDEANGSTANQQLSRFIQQIGKAETEAEYLATAEKAIEENKDNIIGAYALYESYYALGYDKLKALFANEDSYLARHPLAQKPKLYLKGLDLRAPGTQFKDLEEPDADGNIHKLSEYVGQGKWVLVDFWASWCGPCRQEMPNVVAAYEKYHAKGFDIVGLSFDNKKGPWLKAIEDLKMPWIHLSDLKGWKTVASEVYGIRSIPASILVDPTGKIAAIDLRGEALGTKLKEIFGE